MEIKGCNYCKWVGWECGSALCPSCNAISYFVRPAYVMELQNNNEKIQEKLESIKSWIAAYPLDVKVKLKKKKP